MPTQFKHGPLYVYIPVCFILTFQLKHISAKHRFKIPFFKNFILANFNSCFKQGCVTSIFYLVLLGLKFIQQFGAKCCPTRSRVHNYREKKIRMQKNCSTSNWSYNHSLLAAAAQKLIQINDFERPYTCSLMSIGLRKGLLCDPAPIGMELHNMHPFLPLLSVQIQIHT